MLLLGFDTSTAAVTVGLHDGDRVLAEMVTLDARRHGEVLVPSIDAVLAQAGLGVRAVSAVVAGIGPGPYTGLRVGLMTAHALGDALCVPVYGVCTLDVIAHAAVHGCASGPPSGPFLVATDARRKEVYWAEYAADGARLSEPAVNRPSELPHGRQAAGRGAWLYQEAFSGQLEPQYPTAAALVGLTAFRLANGLQLPPPQPLYLRLPDARVPGPPKAVMPR